MIEQFLRTYPGPWRWNDGALSRENCEDEPALMFTDFADPRLMILIERLPDLVRAAGATPDGHRLLAEINNDGVERLSKQLGLLPEYDFSTALRGQVVPGSKMSERVKLRPKDFDQRSSSEQWAIDKALGILDWDGDPNK